MALREKLRTALAETRLLILGSEILFGFNLNGMFQDAFMELSFLTRFLSGCGFVLMSVVIGLLITPSMQHRLVEQGHDSSRIHRVTTRCAELALLPFAMSIGIGVFVVLDRYVGAAMAAAAGGAFLFLALLFWFGIEQLIKPESNMKQSEHKKVPLDTRIDNMLTEARVLLPGAQALLGFQFAVMLAKSFEQLPTSSKIVHVTALAFIALAVILLMTPAAIHRISFQGEETERFLRIGSRFVVCAALPLGLGIGADTYVAITRALESAAAGLACAIAIVVLLITLWFIHPLVLRVSVVKNP